MLRSVRRGSDRLRPMVEWTNRLHIYAQDASHEDAWVVGDREALTALRDALNRVLDGPAATDGAKSFCEDGEGFLTVVVRVDDASLWKTLHLPYATRSISNEDCVHPFAVADEDTYRRLHRA